jgi:hypothetical protein
VKCTYGERRKARKDTAIALQAARSSITNPTELRETLQECEKKAEELIARFKAEIKIVATALAKKETLLPAEFENLPCIKQIREIGIAECKTEKVATLKKKEKKRIVPPLVNFKKRKS